MECSGPAAEALSYPGVPGWSVLPAGVRLTESGAKAPCWEHVVGSSAATLQGHQKRLLERLNEGIDTQQSTKTPSANVMGTWLMFLDGK